MKCAYCGGKLARASAPVHIDRQGVHVTIDEVDAWVCKQCGEPHFEAAEVETIQSIVKVVDDRAKALTSAA